MSPQPLAVSSQQKGNRASSHALAATLVGRQSELAQLQDWLAKADHGNRQIVFVSGEAGIGKTALVNAFQGQFQNSLGQNNLWIEQGQCIEHYGGGEAYLPILDALGRLCRGKMGQECIRLLMQHAPTWLAHMPALLSATALREVQDKIQGVTQERMLRELAEAVEVLTARAPLVLILEDLHWSDYSTLDLLSFLARRQETARLLIIGTYRPEEILGQDAPLLAVKNELQIHGQCQEIRLPFLTQVGSRRIPESPV